MNWVISLVMLILNKPDFFLMLMTWYIPYYDIYDVETNMFGYWGTGENFYPDFNESCVGLIFISDSSNNDLKRDC